MNDITGEPRDWTVVKGFDAFGLCENFPHVTDDCDCNFCVGSEAYPRCVRCNVPSDTPVCFPCTCMLAVRECLERYYGGDEGAEIVRGELQDAVPHHETARRREVT